MQEQLQWADWGSRIITEDGEHEGAFVGGREAAGQKPPESRGATTGRLPGDGLARNRRRIALNLALPSGAGDSTLGRGGMGGPWKFSFFGRALA